MSRREDIELEFLPSEWYYRAGAAILCLSRLGVAKASQVRDCMVNQYEMMASIKRVRAYLQRLGVVGAARWRAGRGWEWLLPMRPETLEDAIRLALELRRKGAFY